MFRQFKNSVLFISLFFLLGTGSALAVINDGNKWGIGLQAAWPVVGISGTYDYGTSPLSFQGVIGLAEFPELAARVRFAFLQEPFFDIYGYGMFGLNDGDEIEPFLGAGFGVDWDWRKVEPTLPPINWSIEAGYNATDFTIGVGIHYTFNYPIK